MFFYIIGWIFFGFFIGLIAKAIHPGKEPMGVLSTISIGLVGSFIGSCITYFVYNDFEFRPAGVFTSVIGAIAYCAILNWCIKKYGKN